MNAVRIPINAIVIVGAILIMKILHNFGKMKVRQITTTTTPFPITTFFKTFILTITITITITTTPSPTTFILFTPSPTTFILFTPSPIGFYGQRLSRLRRNNRFSKRFRFIIRSNHFLSPFIRGISNSSPPHFVMITITIITRTSFSNNSSISISNRFSSNSSLFFDTTFLLLVLLLSTFIPFITFILIIILIIIRFNSRSNRSTIHIFRGIIILLDTIFSFVSSYPLIIRIFFFISYCSTNHFPNSFSSTVNSLSRFL